VAEPIEVRAAPGRAQVSWWAALPLRRRLVISLVAVMSVTLVVVAATTLLSLRSWLVAQIDSDLVGPKAALIAAQGPRGGVEQTIRSWTSAGATVVVVGADGTATPLAQGFPGADDPDPFSAQDAATLASVPTGDAAEPVTIDVDGLGPSRAVAIEVLDQTRQPVTLVALIPLEQASEVIARLFVVELVVVVLALVVVAVVGSILVRRSLRPLEDVAATAGAVAALPLERGDVEIPDRVADPVPTTEVGQVGLAVNAMLDHVEQSLQSRAETEDRLRRFVSDAGHELRTPLAAVRGYAELMRRGAGADPAAAADAAARIEASASRMGLLVEDLLLLASLDEERPLARDVVDLRSVVDEAVAEAATSGADHHWEVEGPESVRVVGDATRLHQAVANLLANARAHTPAGTTVRTTVGVEDTVAVIIVSDDGPGFPPSLIPRATERFTRGDESRSRATGGSGLGLAIVRAVVEAHGGALTVTNGDPGGAVIRIALPVAASAASATSAAPSDADPSA
jgi:two-component system OmpR family sensor kinase